MEPMSEEDIIVLYPSPGIGHIVSMVELAKLLQTHNHSVTILLTTGFLDHPSIHKYINKISISHPSISFFRLPHTPPSNASTTLAAKAFDFIHKNTPHITTILTQISKSKSIKSFILDMFCTSATQPVSSMGIPVYYFFTSGVAVLALFFYFPNIHHQTTTSFKDMHGVELRVPGNAPLKAVNMPESLLDREAPAYWYMLDFCTQLPKARGIIVNSFEELEPLAVKAVADGACFPDAERKHDIYYIGPLIAQSHQSDVTRDGEECLTWLDEQPSKSVVYLCFGSRGTFSVSQLKEIANGLEKSGKRFLWVVKRPIEDEGTKQIIEETTQEFKLSSVLPNGFIERTKDRGLVVRSWAPQVDVLSHESVGGFVTHCGWNSVLEAVVAGVPMIAWPLYAEQHVNRNVMVNDMKVAIAVEQREEDGFVSGDEVDKRVREVMELQDIRDTSFKFKHLALDAFGEVGSSRIALASLVQSWN